MRRRGTVFVVSSVHWHFTWQRHHEISTRLAAIGFDVVFVEPIPKRWPGWQEWRRVWGRLTGRRSIAGGIPQSEPPGVTIRSPVFLPDTNLLTRPVNRRIARRLAADLTRTFAARPRVVIHYLPVAAALTLQRGLDPDLAIYDCVTSWPEDPLARPSALRERSLVESVDVVLADAEHHVARMRRLTDAVVELLPAVDYDRWAPARAAASPSGEPRCAYFGAIHAGLDLGLLRRLSWEVPLRLIGPVQVELGALGSRTELIGAVAAERVPELLADVDVVVLPYRTDGHARGIIPAKTFECLATGRPVVATALPSLRRYADIVTRCGSTDEFIAAVRRAWRDDTPARRDERLAVARSNDWDVRIGELLQVIDHGLQRRAG